MSVSYSCLISVDWAHHVHWRRAERERDATKATAWWWWLSTHYATICTFCEIQMFAYQELCYLHLKNTTIHALLQNSAHYANKAQEHLHKRSSYANIIIMHNVMFVKANVLCTRDDGTVRRLSDESFGVVRIFNRLILLIWHKNWHKWAWEWEKAARGRAKRCCSARESLNLPGTIVLLNKLCAKKKWNT